MKITIDGSSTPQGEPPIFVDPPFGLLLETSPSRFLMPDLDSADIDMDVSDESMIRFVSDGVVLDVFGTFPPPQDPTSPEYEAWRADVMLTEITQATLTGPDARILEFEFAAPTPVSYFGQSTEDALQGNDKILGTEFNDRFFGGAGKDDLIGNAGNDSLFGENGNDSLDGGDGDDHLDGGKGDDTLNGGKGDDYLSVGGGNNTANGKNGNDFLNAFLDSINDDNTLKGGKGDDSFSWGLSGDAVTELVYLVDAELDLLENARGLSTFTTRITIAGKMGAGDDSYYEDSGFADFMEHEFEDIGRPVEGSSLTIGFGTEYFSPPDDPDEKEKGNFKFTYGFDLDPDGPSAALVNFERKVKYDSVETVEIDGRSYDKITIDINNTSDVTLEQVGDHTLITGSGKTFDGYALYRADKIDFEFGKNDDVYTWNEHLDSFGESEVRIGFGGGNDTVKVAQKGAVVDLGNGDDTSKGAKGAQTVIDGKGSDIIKSGKGTDTFYFVLDGKYDELHDWTPGEEIILDGRGGVPADVHVDDLGNGLYQVTWGDDEVLSITTDGLKDYQSKLEKAITIDTMGEIFDLL